MNAKYGLISVLLLLGVVAAVIVGVIYFPRQDQVEFKSTYDPNGAVPTVAVSPTPEQLIFQWDPYDNSEYNFSLEYPSGWQEVDYKAVYKNGGTLIAFSPTALPCPTCSYIKDGYFSLKIYNAKTSPQDYTEFQKRVAGMKQSKEYLGIQLDGAPGVFYGKLATVENNGWVYEFSLDKDRGTSTDNPLESKIFLHALTTFKFTNLQFKM